MVSVAAAAFAVVSVVVVDCLAAHGCRFSAIPVVVVVDFDGHLCSTTLVCLGAVAVGATIAAVDLGEGRCRVEWYMAMEPRGFSRHLMWLTRPVMRIANRRMFRKFKDYTEARVARLEESSALET